MERLGTTAVISWVRASKARGPPELGVGMPTSCLQASLHLGFQSTWLLLRGGLFHHRPFHVDEGALTVSTLFIVIFMLVLLYTF